MKSAKVHPRTFQRGVLTDDSREQSTSAGNYVTEKFKNVTGVNLVEYVARVPSENACDLLENPDRRISEIAFAVGFQSLSQFNRIFKKLSGRSPTQYRAAQASNGSELGDGSQNELEHLLLLRD